MSQDGVSERSSIISSEINPAQRTFRFLQKTGLLDLSSEPEKFQQWINSLDFDQFQDHLVRLNGLLRGLPIKDRTFGGDGVRVCNPISGDIAFLPVREDLKLPLLQSVFTNLKHIPDSKDAGLLLYLSIQAIHPFVDGNGRTGRLLFHLFSHSGQPIQEQEVLSLISHAQGKEDETGRKKIQETIKPAEEISSFINYYYIAPKLLPSEFLQQYGRSFDGFASGVLDIDIGHLSPPVQKKLKEAMADNSGGLFSCRQLAMLSFLNQHNSLLEFQRPALPRPIPPAFFLGNFERENYFQQKEDPQAVKQAQEKYQTHGNFLFNIDSDRFFASINDQQAQELVAIFNQVKQAQIEGLIETISHPRQVTLKDGTPIKDCFYTHII